MDANPKSPKENKYIKEPNFELGIMRLKSSAEVLDEANKKFKKGSQVSSACYDREMTI
jgi:exonuclease VII small subunit